MRKYILENSGIQQMSYGGDGGSFNPIQDTGGQQVIIKSGTKIDSIQIGTLRYGGDGGSPSALFQLPQDGTFTLFELCTNAGVVGYMKFSCNNQTYTAGQTNGDGILIFSTGLKVTFAGISCGKFIDLILFNVK